MQKRQWPLVKHFRATFFIAVISSSVGKPEEQLLTHANQGDVITLKWAVAINDTFLSDIAHVTHI